nr:ABC transporter ATP-binding protein [Metasolibacillus meyeri]
MFYLLQALKKYLRQRKLLVLVIILAILFELGFEYFTSMSMKYLIDFAIVPQDLRMFLIVLVIFVVGGLLSLVIGVAGDYALAKLNEKTMVDVRSDMYARFQQFSSRAFSKYQSGDLLARFTLDMPAVEYAMQQVFAVGIYSILSIIVGIILMFSISWKLMLVAVGSSLLVMLPHLLLSKRAKSYNQSYIDGMEKLSNDIEEEVTSYRTIQVFNLKVSFYQRFMKQMEHLLRFGIKRSFVNSNLERLPVMILTLVNVAVLTVGGYYTFQREMTIGDYIAFNSVFVTFNFAIISFMQMMPIFIEGEVGMRRIKEIEQLAPELEESATAQPLDAAELAIQFNQVSFSYDKERILSDVTLHIAPKQYVAIVGSSGAGKSTLAQLLLRFYKVDQGSISIDNRELEQITLDSLFQAIGVVFQKPYLFNSTIRENLLLAANDASEEHSGNGWLA